MTDITFLLFYLKKTIIVYKQTDGDVPHIKVEKATENGPITRDLLIDDDEEKSQFDFIEKFFKAAQTHKLKVF